MPERRTGLEIVRAGWSSVQDLGRTTWTRYGIARGGAADQHSARYANALVGNPSTNPLIETVASGLAVIAHVDALLAVTGADCDVRVDAVPASGWRPLPVRAGALIEIGAPRAGLRSYLAVRGRIDVPSVAGSVAPDPSLGIGTVLTAGLELGLTGDFRWFAHPYSGIPLLRPRVGRPRFGSPWIVDVVAGPDAGQFAASTTRITEQDYSVDAHSDAVGLRLTGPRPDGGSDAELLSRGVAIGSVEIPPSGPLLVLLRGRLLTAGYPVAAVATTVGQSRLGQAQPGELIRFRSTSLDAARRAAIEARAAEAAVRAAVRTILRTAG